MYVATLLELRDDGGDYYYITAGNWVDSAQDRDYWRALVIAALKILVP